MYINKTKSPEGTLSPDDLPHRALCVSSLLRVRFFIYCVVEYTGCKKEKKNTHKLFFWARIRFFFFWSFFLSFSPAPPSVVVRYGRVVYTELPVYVINAYLVGNGVCGPSLYPRSVVKVDRRGAGAANVINIIVSGHKNFGEFDTVPYVTRARKIRDRGYNVIQGQPPED